MNIVRTLSERLRCWFRNRIPTSDEVTFSQKRIYILPTGAGIVYLSLILVILLLAINYQSNLAYAVCFFLFSLMVTAIFHTYANLAGLQVQADSVVPVFVGELAEFTFRLKSPKSQFRLGFKMLDQREVFVDLEPNQNTRLSISIKAKERGWQAVDWVRVKSTYPLGLFKVWGWFKLHYSALIYPQPIQGGELLSSEGQNDSQAVLGRNKSDELDGFVAYTPGANVHRIAWNLYAKGQGVQVHDFAQTESASSLWLDYAFWPELSTEERLSRLTYWALTCSHRQIAFGLRTPSTLIEPDIGTVHLAEVLKVLALYGKDDA